MVGDFFDRSLVKRWAPLGVTLFALVALLINPVGYVGGGADDVHYLEAARCWVAAGQPCLPESHWWSRWPAVAPIALFTGLLGESRVSVGLGPLIAWIACLVLTGWVGRLWFDRATGLLAAALLAATPVVTQVALQPGTDTSELALQLGALLLATLAYRRQSALLAVVGGAFAALAIQARDTSLIFCGAAALGWLMLDPQRRRVLLWAILGFGGTVALELAGYALATGDPLFRYRLAMGHVAVPSSELAASVDTRQSPLFNPDYIAGWRREAGIRWWWPVDPWLNLIASPRIGLTVAAALLVAPFGWRAMPAEWRRLGTRLLGLALLVSLLLVYGLAVDPKPRMFFDLVAVAALLLAAMAVASWRAGKGLVPAAIVALLLAAGLRVLAMIANTHQLEDRAAGWIAAHRQAIQVDARTMTSLMLVPGARDLPMSGKSLRIVSTNGACEEFGSRVIDRIGGPPQGELCLVETRPR